MTTRGIFVLENIRSRQREGDWVPTPSVWLESARADNAYVGGGMPGSTIMEKLTYTTNSLSRVPSADLNLEYGSNAAPISSAGDGYFVGGNAGLIGNTPSIDRRSYVRKLTYATETISTTSNPVAQSPSTNGQGPQGQGGASSPNFGYTGGGSGGAGGDEKSWVQKMDFASESWTVLPNLPSAIESQGDALGNEDAGYWCGGSPSIRSMVQKVTYSSDTTSRSPSSDLPDGGRYFAGAGNADAGYLMGRDIAGSTAKSTIYKFTYSTQTSSLHPSNMPTGIGQARGTGNLSKGYASGGYGGPSYGDYYSTVSQLDYSTGTPSNIGTLVAGNRKDVFAVSAKNQGITLPAKQTGIRWVDNLVSGTGYGVSFDGNDYLSMTGPGDLGTSTDFTQECWVKVVSQSGGGKRIFSSNQSVNSTQDTQFRQWNADWEVYAGQGSGNRFSFTISGGATLGWHHLALCRKGNTCYFFDNGVLKASDTASHNVTITTHVLGWGYGSEYFDGIISNARFIKGTCLYDSDFTPPTETLTNVTNTTLLCCQSDSDVTAATVGPPSGSITATGDPTVVVQTTIGPRPPAETPTSAKSPGPAFNGAIWMGGYDNDGGPTFSSGGKISFIDDTVTALPSTQLTGSRYNLAATSSLFAGYYGQAATTQVVKVDYATDSPSTMPGGLSGGNSGPAAPYDPRRRGASFGLTTAGYFMNGSTGNSGNLSNLDKITYSTEVIARLPGSNSPNSAYATSGTSNQTTGYKTGGTPGGTPMRKMPFATETWTTAPNALGVTMWDAKTFANTTDGYWMGGDGNTNGSMTYKLTFATEATTRLPSSNVPQRVRYGWGSGNSTHGYISGSNDSAPYRTSYIYKFSYSSDTWSSALPNTMQPNSRQNAAAGARQNGNGDLAPNTIPNTL